LLNSVQSFVTNLSASRPVLLAIDDAQLADQDTVVVLRQLSATSSRRVLVMVTAPEGESTPLIDALGISARRLRLCPLTVEDVSELAARWRVPDAVSDVYSLTGGLPGLVVEALRAVADGAAVDELGLSLPALDEAILNHLRTAGDALVSLLGLAAAVGRRFRFDDLLRMGIPIAEAAAGVQRAMHLGLLEADGDTLAFASGLLHIAVLDAVPEAIRHDLIKGAGLPAGERPGRRPTSTSGDMPAPCDLGDLKPAS
jgi:predicted ATPase